MNLEQYILKQRVYCEEPTCLDKAKVCRNQQGEHKVYCWQHDPETVQSFSAWLDQQGDSLTNEEAWQAERDRDLEHESRVDYESWQTDNQQGE